MKEVIEKIKNARSVAVLPHINEDPDALGSCFAFTKAMQALGKEAVCYVSEELPCRFDFIGGDYVIYNGGAAGEHDLCVCIDCGDILRLGDRVNLFNEIGNTANIDHHITNTNFADANYVDGNASAAGEILCELLPLAGVKVDDEIARFLYIAICSDTGCFKFSNVSPKTLRLIADLLEYDFDHSEIARLLFDSETFNIIKFKAEIMLGIESYADGLITVVELPEELIEKYEIPLNDVPNVVDIPRSVEGSEVALSFKHKGGGIGVNFRSNKYVDVSAVAVKFGGGGHKRAAGCTVKGKDMKTVKREVISECIMAVNKYDK